MDPEGLPFNTTISSGPSFVSLMNSSIYIDPKNCFSDIGNHTLEIKLVDE